MQNHDIGSRGNPPPPIQYIKMLKRSHIQLLSLCIRSLIRTFKEYLKLLNRLYDITCSTISNIPYNLVFTTKFNDSSILITIISCDYLNLSLADEHVGDVTIPTQVIEYNQNFLLADQPIRLKYSNQIKRTPSNLEQHHISKNSL